MRTIIPKNARLVPDQAKKVFEGKIYNVYHWQQEMFDGTEETFEMLKRPDSIKIVAVKNDKVVVLKQKQPNTSEFYDVPGGMHDNSKESELDAAKRELEEETGLVYKNWKFVSIKQPHNKIEQFVYIFLAWDVLKEMEQKLDNGEKISTELWEFKDFKNKLGRDNFRSPKMDWMENISSVLELLLVPEYN